MGITECLGTPNAQSRKHLAELDEIQRQILQAGAQGKGDDRIVLKASLHITLDSV